MEKEKRKNKNWKGLLNQFKVINQFNLVDADGNQLITKACYVTLSSSAALNNENEGVITYLSNFGKFEITPMIDDGVLVCINIKGSELLRSK